ncbi:MAG: NTP transferase domain-containing protein [Elusimicrobiota bacterium]|jgi:GTP:adenosylcobinamide-phosphate guanylyltransferase|nr:NTP transferase domain-containing protein [Elusimicrobiota bacterium]
MKIIIQAGGKGTRLEGLTRNKPKCLVPVDNLPIIFYAFKQFKDADFIIIADYKTDILEKYLAIFAKDYKYKIIKTAKKGTASGIKNALEQIPADEPFMLMWCDLILSEDFKIPTEESNYIGISKDFECRWSYINGEFIKEPSTENGVAGLFIFKDKSQIQNIAEEGAFVEWLKTQNIKFNVLDLNGSKEVGTLLSYKDINNTPLCRPFNQIKFEGDLVTKQGINKQGREIAVDETNWYREVKKSGYENIPEIYDYEPLKMKRVQGRNIYEYDCFTPSQKKAVLGNIIHALKTLHNLMPPKPANDQDSKDNYINKTFDRLHKVETLIPFADKEFIRINKRWYKNIFFSKEEFSHIINGLMPKEFRLIHGDPTFSNMMFDTFNMKTVLIDPRGYFGKTKLYGDPDYDWAKVYYSLKGDYDQFNRKKFTLDIKEKEVELAIKRNNWADMETFFFDSLPDVNKNKIKILHSVIWLSLTTYAWEDYDSICGAFYNGIIQAGDIL